MASNATITFLFLMAAAFALPAFAAIEKDVITPEALQAVLRKKTPISSIMMEEAVLRGAQLDQDVISEVALKAILDSKTLVSKTVLEQAFLKNANNHKAIPCGESCVWIDCLTSALGCSCKNKVCYHD